MEEDDRPTRDQAAFSADEEKTMRNMGLAPGSDVGGYIIDEEIGKGGMGHVYSATHLVIGKRAAVKVLRSEVSKSEITVERFILEARAVNQIGHPNIIDIFAFGTLPDGRAYHIMDLLVGESLRKRLKRGALHASEAASVLEQVASALTAAHEKGFVHRDLKPDNIFLIAKENDWPEVKLLDFGLAKLMPEFGQSPFETKTGMMLGTPEYMSPEQARGEKVDYRTDVYALGIMTFEIIAGERPFPHMGDAFATLQQHADEIPPSLGSVVGGLPDELVQLVDAMLAKEPAARPSLAAVKTVVKRLRSTKLPTRTLAGRQLASLSNPSIEIQISPGPTTMQPGSSSVVGLSLSSLEEASRRSGRAPSGKTPVPQINTAPMVPTQKPPAPMHLPPDAVFGDEGPTLRQRPKPDPMSAAGTSVLPKQPTIPPSNAPARRAPPMSSSGLAANNPISSGIAATTLGVAPPPAQLLKSPGTTKPALPAAAPKSSRTWLIIGAIVAIAAGIGFAIVLLT